MSDRRPILAPLDKAQLANQGLVNTSAQDGTVKLHRRRAYRSSDEEYEEIPLEVRTHVSSGVEGMFITVPDMLISEATIMYVGFTPAKAEQLWHRWTNWPSDGPQREIDEDGGGLEVTFEDLLTGHIGREGSGLLDTFDDNDQEWYECLRDYGLDRTTQEAIMDPMFSYIRMNKTCAFWARDTVAMRYAGLKEIQLASLEREKTLQQTAAGPGQPHTSASGQAGGVSGSASYPGLSGAGTASTGASRPLRTGPSAGQTGMAADSTRSAIALAERNAPGHTLLFKGLDKARISGLFDKSGRVQSFYLLASKPPTGFNEHQSAFYFTPQFPIAEYYASFAKRRAKCEAVVVVAISVPNAAIQSLIPPEIQRLYWPNEDWASMIWHCRAGKPVPVPLRKYRRSILTIGHIARSPDDKYVRMKSPQQIKERNVLRVEGPGGPTKAVQFVFSNDDETRDWLWWNGAQTAKEFGFTKRDLEAWIRDYMARSE